MSSIIKEHSTQVQKKSCEEEEEAWDNFQSML